MLIFSVVIFVFSTLTLSPRPPLPRKVGVMTPQLLWERRPLETGPYIDLYLGAVFVVFVFFQKLCSGYG